MAKKKTPERSFTPEELADFLPVVLISAQKRDLDKMEAAYKKGAKLKLLEAAAWCGKYGFKLPAWITADLGAALERYSTCEVKTLDEAFGVPKRKKGIHVSTSNDFLKKSFPVFWRICVERSGGAKTDDDLFDFVAKEFGINATLAKEYYYYWKKILPVKRKDTPAL